MGKGKVGRKKMFHLISCSRHDSKIAPKNSVQGYSCPVISTSWVLGGLMTMKCFHSCSQAMFYGKSEGTVHM